MEGPWQREEEAAARMGVLEARWVQLGTQTQGQTTAAPQAAAGSRATVAAFMTEGQGIPPTGRAVDIPS